MKALVFTLFFQVILSGNVFAAETNERKSTQAEIVRLTFELFNNKVDEYNWSVIDPTDKFVFNPDTSTYFFKKPGLVVEISIADFLANQILINGKPANLEKILASQLSVKPLNKVTLIFNQIVKNLSADEFSMSDFNLNYAQTAVLISALSKLTTGLSEIGLTCFLGCKDKKREANLSLLHAELKNKKADCLSQQEYQSSRLIAVQRSGNWTLETLLDTAEGQKLKTFYEKIAASTNSKEAFGKVEKILNGSADSKKTNNCPTLITNLSISGAVARSQATSTELSSAIAFCRDLEELNSCLKDVEKGLAIVNSGKSKMGASGGSLERLPASVNNLSK